MVEPGFLNVGWREVAAVLVAVAVIADWAAERYLRPRRGA